jgi:PAS domain S-box-containing protein
LLVYSRKKLISQWLLDRIRANEELAKSEIRFSELFENMSSGVAVYRGIDDGEDFIIVGMNTAGLMISHVQKEDIVGRSVKDVFPGIIGLGLFEVFQRVWKTGNREHHESSLYKDDSHSYWVENYVYRLPSGEIVAIYNDITDRKKAEESLHESEVKFRTIFDSANDGFLITDPVTKKLVQGNAAICSMLGYTKEEIKNLTIHDMHPPDNFSHVVDEFERQVKRESILAEGQPILRKDGSVFYADISSTFTTIRGISYLVGIFRDITERKQAEEVLKESEKKYKELIDGMNETVQVIDFNGNLIDVNKTAIEVLGYSKEELLAIGLHGIDSSLKKEDIKALANAMPSDKLQIFETSHKTKDGRTFPVEVCSSLVTYKGKQVILSIARNITERKLAEEELKQTFEKLRKSLIGTIQALSSTVETRDPYTSGHQKRVSNLARAIAQEMGLSNDTIDNIRMAGIIHDIGKVSVPAEILSKPGKISDLEMSLIRIHPQSGYDILKDVELPYPIAEVVLQHHERMDGSGYPQGLKGNQILLEAKIIAVADVIEAIASHRPYRPAKGIDAALEEIERNKGILYDEKVVEVCLKLFREKEFEFESTES